MVNNESPEPNIPVPVDVQIPVVVPLDTEPNSGKSELLAQTEVSFPAITRGKEVMIEIEIVSVLETHFPLFVDSRTSSTEPLVTSAALRKYMALRMLASSKLPEPSVLHKPLVVAPVITPYNWD